MKALLFGASGAVLLASLAAPVQAQATQEQATRLDEIVVTAQRREEAAQDVGQALSLIAGDALEERAVLVINDIENVVPNMEVDSQFGGGQPQFRIRGIGAREYSSNNASTVGVYVDEVAHPYTVTTQGALFDLARIEVLRGPQGTLYGRNTTGGAVNLVTNAPTADARVGALVEYGTYDRAKVEGYISGPIAPGLLGRLAAVAEQGGAWQYNRDTGEELGDLDKTAVRGRLTWDVTEALTADLSATWSQDRSDGLGFRLLGPYTPSGSTTTIPADTAWRITGWELSPELAAVSGRQVGDNPGRDNEGLDLSARLTADLGFADLTSITAWQSFERDEYNDWDGTRFAESDVWFYNDIDVFSQELRLASQGGGRFDWLVGAHYADEANDGGFVTQFRGFGQTLIETAYEQDVEAIGVFTHNSYRLTDRLSLIGGLRYEYEERSLTSAGTAVGGVPGGPELRYDTDLSEVSGRVGLEYELSDDALLYAGVARGVKSGGFTTYNATSATPFKPEIVIAYEAGLKSDWLDDRLRLNAAVFFYDYTDQQVQGLEYDREVGRLGKITNVPESHILGGEIELTWVPVDGLTISQSLGYKDGEYDEYDAIDGAATDAANPPDGPWDIIITNDRSGEQLQFPPLTYAGAVSYDWLAAGWDWRAETNYSYRDELYSVSSSSIIDDYWLVNASLSTGPANANWRVGLWARNLFDEYYEETRNGFNGSARPTTSPRQGRTVGVRLTMDF
ncbi:TonB-dependent receptor [Brevundimonas lutea]|uniref:TonB-dependent receptor n=1 Tax=Brevundimonas lutea TaxID=2293980 RepID=UPI000F0242E2|nr:TonB-dependent receptor [Brevundimonas lutea]